MTESEYPLDFRFRGNEVLIKNYIANSPNEHFVLSGKNRFTETNRRLFSNHLGSIDEAIQQDAIIIHDFRRRNIRILAESDFKGPIVFYAHCLAELYPFAGNSKRNQNDARIVKELMSKKNFHIVAVSEAAKISLEPSFPGAQIDIVEGSADPELYYPTYGRTELVEAEKVIGFSGRPDNIKGVRTLLETMKRFAHRKDVGFYLTLSGSNQKRFDAVEYISQNMPDMVRQDRVKIGIDLAKLTTGDEEKDRMVRRELYTKAVGQDVFDHSTFVDFTYTPMQRLIDVYFHPANTEAYGLTILEAMMSGKPVVASNVGGIPEIVGENGRLVDLSERTRSAFKSREKDPEQRDVDRFYDALCEAIDNPEDPQKIAASVEDKTPEAAAQRLDRLLEQYSNQ